MTDSRLLRDYEMKNYSLEFGRKQLPIEVWKDTTLLNRFYLRNTRLTFDWTQVENAHEVVRRTDSVSEDYDITLYANSDDAGTDADVVVFMVIAEEYEFNKDGSIKKLN
jgi:hypothetical protein